MATREINLERLLGKKVRDSTGKVIGRIEEVLVQQHGEDWVVQEYRVGSTALLERLSAWTIGLAILHSFGATKILGGYRLSWDQLDLTNPDHPCLRCSLQELQAD